MSFAALGLMAGASLAPQIMSLFQNNDPYKDVRKTMQRGNEFAAAAADPTSKMFKAAAAEAEGPQRRKAIQAIDEMFKMDRRQRARGYGGGVTSERRDEMRSKALSAAFEQAAMQGRADARQRLSGAADTLYGYAKPATELADRENAQQLARQQTIQNLFNVGGSLAGAGIDTFWPTADADIASFFSGGSSWGPPSKSSVVAGGSGIQGFKNVFGSSGIQGYKQRFVS